MPRLLFAILLILTGATSKAHACSCIFLSNVRGCNKSWTTEGTVFVGTVTAKTPREESGGGTRLFSRYAVHFSDVEILRGNSANDKELVVNTGLGGGDCGYPFATGTRYLVYASTWNGQLGTGICSPTSPEITARGAIKELRALRDTGRADDLFGIVSEAPRGYRYEDRVDAHPLAGVAIHLIGSSGERFSTTTDTDGVYSFSILPHSTYRVEHDLPLGLISGRDPKEPISVDLSNQGGLGAGCEVNVSAVPDGVISGTVVDGKGKGLAGFVTVQPIDPAEAKLSLQLGGLPGYDTDDGKFTLSRLPPGHYQLVFRPKGADFSHKFFWPAGNDRSSDAIDLVLGQHVENIRFEVVLSSVRN